MSVDNPTLTLRAGSLPRGNDADLLQWNINCMTIVEPNCFELGTAATHFCGLTGMRPDRPDLSTREIEVLIAWMRTESKAVVGRELYISPRTVSTHLERIRAKYAAVGRPARTKAALAARAIQDGLVCLYEL